MNEVKRDNRGRIVAGSGPNNPNGKPTGRRDTITAERRDAVLAVLHEEVSLEDWRDIVRAQVAKAKEGQWRSVEWLSKYILGAPPEYDQRIAQQVIVELFGLTASNGQEPDVVTIEPENDHV